jgi:hypothetical protein
MATALCLLCLNPKEVWCEFLNAFTHYPIYMMVDNESTDITTLSARYPNIRFLQVPATVCDAAGFKDVNHFGVKKLISAWEKATYYFSHTDYEHERIWFIEDDVFFHSEQTLLSIDAKHPDEDLLCNSPFTPNPSLHPVWRGEVTANMPGPYYIGMLCASRHSRRFLECLREHATREGALCFLEVCFPTVVVQRGLRYARPAELHTVVFPNKKIVQKRSIPGRFQPILCGPKDKRKQDISTYNATNVYHAVKNVGLHPVMRAIISQKK